MKAWWESRHPRERLLLAVGGILVFAALIYLLTWAPFSGKRASLATNVQVQRDTLDWMREASRQIGHMRSRSPQSGAGAGANRSLLSIIDSSAKQANIRNPIKRMDPEGKDGVKLWIENADFDTLIGWLGDMQRKYNVSVARATFTGSDNSGRVSSRLSLQR